jgi:hypothetical protein
MIIFQVEPGQDIEELLNIRHVLGQGVKWEKLRLSGPIQSMNCQDFGHAPANYTRGYRCAKYKLSHGPKDKDKPICTYCGKEHPANYRGQPYYRDILKSRKKQILKTRERLTNLTKLL